MKKLYLFFIFLSFISAFNLKAQLPQNIKFYTLPEGISNNLVSCIMQDKQGFIWLGTGSGINRFDGYTFTNPASSIENKSRINRRIVRHIYQDSRGDIWISTEGAGLYQYNPELDKFTLFVSGDADQNVLTNTINQVHEDQKGRIWIATGEGLDLYNPETKKIKHFISRNQKLDLESIEIRDFVEDTQGFLWLATIKSGLGRFDKNSGKFTFFSQAYLGLEEKNIEVIIPSQEKNKFWIGYEKSGFALISVHEGMPKVLKRYKHNPDNPNSLAGDLVKALFQDSQGILWIGTENKGLSIFDPKTETFNNYQHDDQYEYSLSHNSIWSIFEDSFGNMWVGTFNQGVNIIYNQYYDKFDLYQHKKGQDNTLINNNISRFWEASNQQIWISTDGGGVSLWDRKQGSFTNFNQENSNLQGNAVLSICEDPIGNIWFSTWEAGINIYNKESEEFTVIRADTNLLSSNSSFSMITGQDGNIYVCTWRDHLDVFDPISRKRLWSRDFLKYNFKNLNNIIEDKDQNLWIGSYGGLLLITKENRHIDGKVQIFKHDEDQFTSLSDDNIHAIFEDSKGNIWLGTAYGLNLYRPENKNFSTYFKQDGLPDDNIRGIGEDLSGNLWVTTNKGLVKFDTKNDSFITYGHEDGLQGNIFSKNAIHLLKSGEMLVGGSNGFNIFNPQKIPKNPYLPKVHLTQFKILNKVIDLKTPNSPLKKNIAFTDEITLSYKQATFSIDFVAINYTHTAENQYAYFLEGLDKDWNYIGHKHEANYTALQAGTYTFKVKAANNDGIWNEEETILKIIILPPWWATWWFRVILLFSIVSFILIGLSWRIRSIKAQNTKLERLVKERTIELQSKNDEVTQQAEELHQQAEELMSQRDFIQIQNTELSSKNKTVRDQNQRIEQSIKAAKNIQHAVLPHDAKLQHILKSYFLISRPKDVVSGDFYWLKTINQTTVLVVADCTGHGVPGAFMTLIGSILLDKIIKQSKVTSPAQILTQLHDEVYQVLSQKYNQVNNGMDAVVISYTPLNQNEFTIQFAGAKNSIYYTTDKVKSKVIELKGTRRGIGGYQNQSITFENHEFTLHKGSRVYLGSDGFIDQNNNKRKKFGVKRFKKLIALMEAIPLVRQKELFEKALDKHSEDTLQRDDILLIGIEL